MLILMLIMLILILNVNFNFCFNSNVVYFNNFTRGVIQQFGFKNIFKFIIQKDIRNREQDMGVNNSKYDDILSFNSDEWKQIAHQKYNKKILESLDGKEQAELYTISFDQTKNINKQYEIYRYRKNQDNALVKCISLMNQRNRQSKGICAKNNFLKVLTELISLRLSQFPQLSFPQCLYVLSQSIRGFQFCYHKLGHFDINEEMIGVNKNGQLKVWVNQNFGQNHPNSQKPVFQTSSIQQGNLYQNLTKNNDQSLMVNNILSLIQKKCDKGRFPRQFVNFLNKEPLNFNNILSKIQTFTNLNNIFIPDGLINLLNSNSQRLTSMSSKGNIKTSQNTQKNQNNKINHNIPYQNAQTQQSFKFKNKDLSIIGSNLREKPLYRQQQRELNASNILNYQQRFSQPIYNQISNQFRHINIQAQKSQIPKVVFNFVNDYRHK